MGEYNKQTFAAGNIFFVYDVKFTKHS